MNDKKYSVSDLLLFNESPFAYWCKTVNNLVEKGKIDESYRIPATESNLYSEHFLNKTEAHEVKLKDYYLIQQEKNVVDQYFNENRFSTTECQLSEPPRTLKRKKKNRPSTITRCHSGPKIQKHIDHFDIFPVHGEPFELTHR